jgi:hypothetical protein
LQNARSKPTYFSVGYPCGSPCIRRDKIGLPIGGCHCKGSSNGKRFKWQKRKIVFLLEENKINHLKTKEE